uniref:Uncharacterized protein n=1 Tax=Anguilla anguilla TaxID=7936 RepID=A0A0E9WVE5_ANGAN
MTMQRHLLVSGHYYTILQQTRVQCTAHVLLCSALALNAPNITNWLNKRQSLDCIKHEHPRVNE